MNVRHLFLFLCGDLCIYFHACIRYILHLLFFNFKISKVFENERWITDQGICL